MITDHYGFLDIVFRQNDIGRAELFYNLV